MAKGWRKFLFISGGSAILMTAVFLIGLAIVQKAQAIYSFDSYEPSGFKALAELLTQEGYTLELDTDAEPHLDGETLLMLPPGVKITVAQQWRFQQWVDGGGRMVEFSAARPQLMFPWTGTEPLRISESQIRPVRSSVPGMNGLIYHLHPSTVYGMGQSRVDRGFYAVEETFIIYSQNWGRGTVLYWNDPEGLTNRRVATYSDHAVIFAMILQSMAPDRTIRVWQPRRDASSIPERTFSGRHFSLARFGALCLLIFALSLSVWKFIPRFGRAQPLTLIKGRPRDEFLHSLAGLFYQADAREWVISQLWSALLQIMAEIAGASEPKEAEWLADRVGAITGKPNITFYELRQKLTERRYLHSKPEFLRLILQIESYGQELREWQLHTQ